MRQNAVKFTDSIKERLLFGLGGLILGAVVTVGTSLLREAYPPFEKDVLPAISKSSLLSLCLLLAMICLASCAWLVALLLEDKTGRLKKKYAFIPERAFYRNKETGEPVCSNCLLKGIAVPLAKTFNHGQHIWKCTNRECSVTYLRLPEEL
jgi:hypothetical protein